MAWNMRQSSRAAASDGPRCFCDAADSPVTTMSEGRISCAEAGMCEVPISSTQ
ncbi:hypothetical protein D3C72_2519150 [compost metagenome]